MKPVAIIQARVSSNRLPGKVLTPLGGIPLLLRVIEQVKRSDLVYIVVATSIDPSDDPIVEICKKIGVECFRGPLENVAQRFAEVLGKSQSPFFIRICADSPFYDRKLMEKGINIFISEDLDLVTNVFPRTFPKGESIEIVKTKTFLETLPHIQSEKDKENVTSYFYTNSDEFKIVNFTSDDDMSAVNLVVDTGEDLSRAEKICKNLGDKQFEIDWREVVDIYRKLEQ